MYFLLHSNYEKKQNKTKQKILPLIAMSMSSSRQFDRVGASNFNYLLFWLKFIILFVFLSEIFFRCPLKFPQKEKRYMHMYCGTC